MPLPAVAFAEAPAQGAHPSGCSAAAGTPPAAGDAAAPDALEPLLLLEHSGESLVVVRPGRPAPETLSCEGVRARCAPCLLLAAEADPPLAETAGGAEGAAPAKPFGFSWFVPELLRHRQLWRDVLLASLAGSSSERRPSFAFWANHLA